MPRPTLCCAVRPGVTDELLENFLFDEEQERTLTTYDKWQVVRHAAEQVLSVYANRSNARWLEKEAWTAPTILDTNAVAASGRGPGEGASQGGGVGCAWGQGGGGAGGGLKSGPGPMGTKACGVVVGGRGEVGSWCHPGMRSWRLRLRSAGLAVRGRCAKL